MDVNTVRFHIDCSMPVRPPMAAAVYHAQLCSDGHYRQCIDVHLENVTAFEQWAERVAAIIKYEA